LYGSAFAARSYIRRYSSCCIATATQTTNWPATALHAAATGTHVQHFQQARQLSKHPASLQVPRDQVLHTANSTFGIKVQPLVEQQHSNGQTTSTTVSMCSKIADSNIIHANPWGLLHCLHCLNTSVHVHADSAAHHCKCCRAQQTTVGFHACPCTLDPAPCSNLLPMKNGVDSRVRKQNGAWC
jgi:hypothetical protein